MRGGGKRGSNGVFSLFQDFPVLGIPQRGRVGGWGGGARGRVRGGGGESRHHIFIIIFFLYGEIGIGVCERKVFFNKAGKGGGCINK